MANYTIAIDWAGKDALSDSDPAKIISGDDFNSEFVAVRTAVNSKAELNGSSGENFTANNLTAAGTLGVTGATTLSSTLGVTGATTLSSTLGVTGATTLSSTLGVTGASTFAANITGTTARSTFVTDNDGSFDLNAGTNFTCTPTGSITLTFTNIPNGQSGFILLINTTPQTVTLHTNSKADSNFLTTINVAGTYLISYIANGTNVYLTNSGAIS